MFSVVFLIFSVQCSVVTDETYNIVLKAKTTPTEHHDPGYKVVELFSAKKSLPSAVVRGLVQSIWFEKITSSY